MLKRIITAFIALCILMQSNASEVKLKWIYQTPTSKSGVSWGVPLPKGKFKKNQQFSLINPSSGETPLQSWPLAYWPDGSVKWMGLAGTLPQVTSFELKAVNQNIIPSKLIIDDNQNQIIIQNENQKIILNKNGKNLIEAIYLNNIQIGATGKLLCSLEDRSEENKIEFNHFESEITNAVVEQSGPLRTVVKFEGQHHASDGRKIFPFTVRMYFHQGISNIRMVHTFMYDGNMEKDFLKSIGISFDVPFRESTHNRHVAFTSSDGGVWTEPIRPLVTRYPFIFKGQKNLPDIQMDGKKLPEITKDDSIAYERFRHLPVWDSYKLTQLHPGAFTITKKANDVSSSLTAAYGNKSSGTAMVGDVSGALAISVKNFWQSFPSSLEVRNTSSEKAKLLAWFWSPDAESMDFRHYDTIPHDLLSTYEDVQPGLSTPVGIARTSEFTLQLLEKIPAKDELVSMARDASITNIPVCTPEYLHKMKAFGSWSLPDTTTIIKKWIENQLDSSILYYKRAIQEHQWYGFWNYGDVMHTYDPYRHMWRYDVGGYAWANTELAPGNWLWYSYLRTGNADIFTMAEAMTRHNGEVDCYHAGEMKGLGTRHNVTHWGCGAKEARIGQAAWKRQYYYLTTDERCGDLITESLDAEESTCKMDPLRIAQPASEYPYNAPARLRWGPDWLALAGNWMTAWERTGDKKYLNKIMAGLESLSTLKDGLFTGPTGLGYDPATGKLSYSGQEGVTNKNHLATIMSGFELLTEMFDMIDYPPFRKTFTEYCKYYSMPSNDIQREEDKRKWGNIAFKIPRLTAFAAKELNNKQLANRAWSEFFQESWGERGISLKSLYSDKLIQKPAVLNDIHENTHVGTNGTSIWGLNAIFMLELIGDELPDLEDIQNQDKWNKLTSLKLKTVLEDNFSQGWQKNWFLDGEKAELSVEKNSLIFKAGKIPASDADHSVIWTNQTFQGDLKIDFDFVRLDKATKFVNILYIKAEGKDEGAYSKDITTWKNLRKVPSMKMYYDNMNLYHISFAAFENENKNPANDYIRARRYIPGNNLGLTNTDFTPTYTNTGFFKPGVLHHISVLQVADEILMKVENNENSKIYQWNVSQFPLLKEGRIGFRLMGSRSSAFSNIKISAF